MYVRSAQLYDRLYHFKDYARASADLRSLLQEHRPQARSLLDVACSTGRHLENLQQHYQVEGLDISPELLEVARRRCPAVPFHQGDMCDFDLGRRFDVVTCLFASIAYIRTVENLHRAIANMARHLQPDGLFVVEPWLTPEQFWPDHLVMNTTDQAGEKICWMYVAKAQDRVVTHDINFMVGTREGVSHFQERHQMGLFRAEDYAQAMEAAGLTLIRSDPKGFFGNGLHVAARRMQ